MAKIEIWSRYVKGAGVVAEYLTWDDKPVERAYDPLEDMLSDFVEISTNGSDSALFVDADGAGTAYGMVQIASIIGVTGITDEAALLAAGNLVVH